VVLITSTNSKETSHINEEITLRTRNLLHTHNPLSFQIIHHKFVTAQVEENLMDTPQVRKRHRKFERTGHI
ncbi:LOW QUALITY PROTEIN: hypothetical protein TorRG33x02_129460, partial [Trema orientale]